LGIGSFMLLGGIGLDFYLCSKVKPPPPPRRPS
jgi:hypothetical protein